MICEDKDSQYNKGLIKPLRRTGPLDAYIYKQGADKEDVKEIQDNVVINNHILTVSKEKKENIMHVFTDGACPGNGKRNANAAWGALLVSDNGYIVLDRFSGAIPLSESQTNQRAELTALLRGLEVAEKQLARDTTLKKIQIWSDSQYSINCASVWGPMWKSRGWKKQGGEIQHLDLIRVLVEKTQSLGFKIEYRWLKGHKGGESQRVFPWKFNHMVDELANSALR
jgi:ribonuclease HI